MDTTGPCTWFSWSHTKLNSFIKFNRFYVQHLNHLNFVSNNWVYSQQYKIKYGGVGKDKKKKWNTKIYTLEVDPKVQKKKKKKNSIQQKTLELDPSL